MRTVLVASALPLIVGVVVLISAPAVGLVMDGAAGGWVSGIVNLIIIVTAPDVLLTFPARSVAVVVSTLLPTESAVEGIQLKLPEESANVLQIMAPLAKISTMLLDSALPAISGVVVLTVLLAAGEVIVGAAGA